MMRTFFWLGGLGLVFLAWQVTARINLASHYETCEAQSRPARDVDIALERTRAFIACLDREAGLLDRPLLKAITHFVTPMPLTPAQYRGTWIAARPESTYRITLREDGSFIAVQEAGRPQLMGEAITGAWSVVENKFVWLYDEGRIWPPDINPIGEETADGFSLREADGSMTRYRRAAMISD